MSAPSSAERRALNTGRMRQMVGSDADVVTLARDRLRQTYDLFDTVAVSFSGGKDSTVVLNLAIEVGRELGRLPIPVFFYDEEAIPYETEAYVRRVAEQHRGEIDLQWLCLPIQHRNACSRSSPFWWPWAPEDEERWVRPLPPEAITTVPGFPMERDERPTMPSSVGLLFRPAEKFGRVAMVMGIRAQESITRTRAVLARSPDTRPWIRPWAEGYASKGVLFKSYPIYDWRTEDVWTAPARFGWDYNRAYDVMELAGVKHLDQRCAPPYGEEPMQNLNRFATCFPDIWDRMAYRVPGAATAARYSRTELYSFRSRPKKPADMTWPEFIRWWVEKHPPQWRGEIAKRVQDHIRVHFDKTTEPIAVKAPHPVSGVSWEFLLMVAVRGDYKDRKQPTREGDTEKARTRYEKDIADMRERGEL